jgi:hypothetical protein
MDLMIHLYACEVARKRERREDEEEREGGGEDVGY